MPPGGKKVVSIVILRGYAGAGWEDGGISNETHNLILPVLMLVSLKRYQLLCSLPPAHPLFFNNTISVSLSVIQRLETPVAITAPLITHDLVLMGLYGTKLVHRCIND